MNNEFNQKKPNPKFNPSDFEGGWHKYLVNAQPPFEPALIKINDVTICTPKNVSLIVGKKKSRKSLFLVYLISLYTGNIKEDILLCDTEQGIGHVWKSRDRIYRLTGHYVDTLSLRALSYKERRDIIEQAIKEDNFKVIIIDGIRDLLSNINDPDQSNDLITWLLKM